VPVTVETAHVERPARHRLRPLLRRNIEVERQTYFQPRPGRSEPRFEDRGLAELKDVPGEWRLLAVV
jgi:hypothetical protein